MTCPPLGPPPVPNRATYPFVGTFEWRGLLFDIETREGGVREGVGWRVTMPAHYGEVRGVRSSLDGDGLDVFVGPDPEGAAFAYVVHQKHPGGQRLDEDKVMIGWPTAEAAERDYRRAYTSGGFWGGMTRWPADELAAYLRSRTEVGRLDAPPSTLRQEPTATTPLTLAGAGGYVPRVTRSGTMHYARRPLRPLELLRLVGRLRDEQGAAPAVQVEVEPTPGARRLGLLAAPEDFAPWGFGRPELGHAPDLTDTDTAHLCLPPAELVALAGGASEDHPGERGETERLAAALREAFRDQAPLVWPARLVVEATPAGWRVVELHGRHRAAAAQTVGLPFVPVVVRLVRRGEQVLADAGPGSLDLDPTLAHIAAGHDVTVRGLAGPVLLHAALAADVATTAHGGEAPGAGVGALELAGPAVAGGPPRGNARLHLSPSKSNPRVRRWTLGDQAEARPAERPRASFIHPDTGARTIGTIIGRGEAGVTVLDEQGQTIKLRRGQYGEVADGAGKTPRGERVEARGAGADGAGKPPAKPAPPKPAADKAARPGKMSKVGDLGDGNPGEVYDEPMPSLPDGFNDLPKTERARLTADLAVVRREMDARYPVKMGGDTPASVRAAARGYFDEAVAAGWINRGNAGLGHRLIDGLAKRLVAAGLSVDDQREVMGRSVQKLIHQEFEATRRTLGDHGLRHIAHNVEHMDRVLDAVNRGGVKVDARDRVTATLAMIHHDLGYGIPAISRGGFKVKDNYHPQASAVLWRQEVAADPALARTVGDRVSASEGWIANHSGTDIAWQTDPVGTAIRVADNTHLFADKMPEVLFGDSRAVNLMVRLHLALEAGADWKPLKTAFKSYLESRPDLGGPQKRALLQAADEIGPATPKFLISRLAGRDMTSTYDAGSNTLMAEVEQSPLRSFIGRIFGEDKQDQQFSKLLGDFGADPGVIAEQPVPEVRLGRDQGSLVLRWTPPRTGLNRQEREFARTMEEARRSWAEIQAMPGGTTREAALHGFLTQLAKGADLVIAEVGRG